MKRLCDFSLFFWEKAVCTGRKKQTDCWIIRSNSLLLCSIWCEMTEDHKKMLAVFEVRVRDLMELCRMQKQKISELQDSLVQKEEELQQAAGKIEELNAKYDNMLTARVVSVNEGEMKSARMRLSRLVREVDKCIALLNE